MIIACATDEAYAPMAGVLLRSLALNGDVADVPVALIGDNLSADTADALRACAAGLEFRIIDLASARKSIADLPISFYSTAIHIRLLLPDLVPEGGRLLYLDSDILVNRSLRPLLDLSLDDHLAAAVPDGGRSDIRAIANHRLGRPLDAPYFNSGVLLFDLDEWRRLRIGERCIRCAEAREDYWPDQDAINLILDGRIKSLDRSWNFFSHDVLPRDEYAKAHILHFIPEKPVLPNCRHPMFEDYLAVRASTPWRDEPLAGTVRQRRIDLIVQMAAERVKRRRTQR